MLTRNHVVDAVLLVVVFWAAGCDGNGSGRVCDPGQMLPCTCTDGRSGAQSCRDDGSGWQECVCTGDLDADTDADVGEDAVIDTSGDPVPDLEGDTEEDVDPDGESDAPIDSEGDANIDAEADGDPGPVVDEDFETGDLTLFPWVTSETHGWVVQAGEGVAGSFAARTHPDHGADETSTLSVSLFIRENAPISFWIAMETEDTHYEISFHIDGMEQGRWSGLNDWARYEYPVTTGRHTFEWRYERDDFVSSEHPMRNTVWLDDIDFPGYNVQPSVPDVVWPFDNALIQDTSPAISWSSDDPDPGDTITYEVQLDTSTSFPAPTSPGESTSTTYVPGSPLSADTTYWWRVRSKDDFADEWGEWSPARSFTVDPASPRIAWLQTTPEQLLTGDVTGLLSDGSGVANPENVTVNTPYDDGSGCNFVSVRKAYSTSEDAVYCTHAPTVGYEYHHYDWTTDIAYGYDGGFRFQGVPIPAGVEIVSAELCLMQCYTCYGYGDRSDAVISLEITADRVSDAGVWPSSGTVMTGYTPTTASVPWSVIGVYPSGTCIASPDVTDIVREVIDLPGWSPGNAIRFLLTDTHGHGTYSSTQYWDRLFYSSNNKLSVTFEAEGSIVSPPISFADIPGALFWDQIQWEGSGSVLLHVLDGDGIPIPDTDLPGNAAGFTDTTIPLWGLDPAAYPQLRLMAVLARVGDTSVATLDSWLVTWGSELLWGFDNDGDLEGWTYGPLTAGTTVAVSGGVFRVDSDGADPHLSLLGLNLPAASFTEMEVVLRTGNTGGYDVVTASWANETGGFGIHTRPSTDVFLLDFTTVTIDLVSGSGSGTWDGTIFNLRLDPVDTWEGTASWFEVDRIILR